MKSSALFHFAILLLIKFSQANETPTTTATPTSTTSPPTGQGGRTFFLFGGFFRKLRERWHGQSDPVPLYAGPAYPLTGYFNCPIYGCNPALNYRPEPYEPANYYNRHLYNYNFAMPPGAAALTSQQQQSNIIIYQNGQASPHSPLPPYAGTQFYAPYAPAFPGVGNIAPMNNGVFGYQANSPQFPANNFNGYNGPAPPLPSPAINAQNYAQTTYLPACSPQLYPCHSGG